MRKIGLFENSDYIDSRELELLQKTVDALKNYSSDYGNLTVQSLYKQWLPCKAESYCSFTGFEQQALIYLCTGKPPKEQIGIPYSEIPKLSKHLRVNLTDALNEINKLTIQQVHALTICFHLGLRAFHLKKWLPAEGEKIFSAEHALALVHLIIKHQFPPEKAINYITKITFKQALSITAPSYQQDLPPLETVDKQNSVQRSLAKEENSIEAPIAFRNFNM